jgi:glycosyltransferase involved in cell wall biosynthesis
LRRAIQSALGQTRHDLLVCVYDNSSGDETGSVVEDMAARDSRLSYYRHAQPIAVAENFLFGMERVNTPYFSFLSDDDVLFPRFYEIAIAKLEERPDALFAAGSTLEFDEGGSVRYAPLAFWGREGSYSPPEGFLAMLGNRHPTWTAILFRREALEKAGLLDTAIVGPIDLDYELRIASRFPYLVFFEPSAGYVHHQDRVSVAEDSGVIAGYRRIANKLSGDSRIDAALRAVIPKLLGKQMRLKLYEIAVKSIIASDDARAGGAAMVLRQEFSQPVIASAINAAIGVCRRAPPVRSALAAVEAMRLRARSSATRRRLLAGIGQDGSAYGRAFLANPQERRA